MEVEWSQLEKILKIKFYITEDSLNVDSIKCVNENIENYLNRIIEAYETDGYGERIRTEKDWKADAAEALEVQ